MLCNLDSTLYYNLTTKTNLHLVKRNSQKKIFSIINIFFSCKYFLFIKQCPHFVYIKLTFILETFKVPLIAAHISSKRHSQKEKKMYQ